jgi:hypothetical protein
MAVGIGVYLITNPYIVINTFANRDVLRSNFSNSLAMYEITRISEGFVRVLELTVEGATLPVLVLGTMALIVALARRGRVARGTPSPAAGDARKDDADPRGLATTSRCGLHVGQGPGGDPGLPLRVAMLPLAVPAVVFFLQFVMIGAGKPAEYGRFGIFTNTALVIGAAGLLTRRWLRLREIVNWIPATFVIIWVAFFGAAYLRNFHLDAAHEGTRAMLAQALACNERNTSTGRCLWSLAVRAEPAPFNCPPVDFSSTDVVMYASDEAVWRDPARPFPFHPTLVVPADVPDPAKVREPDLGRSAGSPDLRPPSRWNQFARMLRRPTPISWANKLFYIGLSPTDASFYRAEAPIHSTSPEPGRRPR